MIDCPFKEEMLQIIRDFDDRMMDIDKMQDNEEKNTLSTD